jgi:hypothetical protein
MQLTNSVQDINQINARDLCTEDSELRLKRNELLWVKYWLEYRWKLSFCRRWKPLWSSDQSSWLQSQRYGFDSRRYEISWEVVGLERGPLSLVSTIEELVEKKVAAPI